MAFHELQAEERDDASGQGSEGQERRDMGGRQTEKRGGETEEKRGEREIEESRRKMEKTVGDYDRRGKRLVEKIGTTD